MISKEIENALNEQVKLEAESSQFYLAMAGWCEQKGLANTATFMYTHSDEERQHMLKLFKYINERGGKAQISALTAVEGNFGSLRDVFQNLYDHELMVSAKINELIYLCQEQRDFTTQNFLQWYVAEQIEEEALARDILDKLSLMGEDGSALYFFDRDIMTIRRENSAGNTQQ
ncbi:MAG: ferritin [Flavobacteriales bacterium]|jgi:ferritin|nr:ferritin [Flavobacteriales bacterium]